MRCSSRSTQKAAVLHKRSARGTASGICSLLSAADRSSCAGLSAFSRPPTTAVKHRVSDHPPPPSRPHRLHTKAYKGTGENETISTYSRFPFSRLREPLGRRRARRHEAPQPALWHPLPSGHSQNCAPSPRILFSVRPASYGVHCSQPPLPFISALPGAAPQPLIVERSGSAGGPGASESTICVLMSYFMCQQQFSYIQRGSV